ncbi:MAG: TlpA family protein disulfide reductase [Acidobacteriota bacterium]|nr:TlpA family protein disulfide reductase [Acidobacteriota bacterium]
MKNIIKNTLLFIILCVAFSNWTACTKSPSLNSDGTTISVAPNASNSTASTDTGDSLYPPAPEGILQTENKDLEGKVLKIGDYQGKVVLVNLWATWCGPCRAEMPTFIDLQEKYKDKDFVVIGLDADEETVEEVNNFAKDVKLNYKLGFADQKMVSAFIKLTKLQGIPQTIVINRAGKMTGIWGGGGQKNLTQIRDAVDKAVSNS